MERVQISVDDRPVILMLAKLLEKFVLAAATQSELRPMNFQQQLGAHGG